jgi:transposase
LKQQGIFPRRTVCLVLFVAWANHFRRIRTRHVQSALDNSACCCLPVVSAITRP